MKKINVFFIGPQNTGKTSIILYLCDDINFNFNKPRKTEKLDIFIFSIQNTAILMWDCNDTGEELLNNMSYNIDIIVIVIDVNNDKKTVMDTLKKIPNKCKKKRNIIIICNKIDMLKRDSSIDKYINKYFDEWSLRVFYISMKKKVAIKSLKRYITKFIIKNFIF